MCIRDRSTGDSPPATPASNSDTYTQPFRSDGLLGRCRFGDTDTGGLPSAGQRPERVGDCRGFDRGGGSCGCSCDGARDGYFSDIDVEFAEAFGEYADKFGFGCVLECDAVVAEELCEPVGLG